ncbi:ECF-type thiazole transporter [Fructobacillus fructosus]|uniref:energy coupling factor transporter S component ThiW n=1 Tax=Fructobacillus fructosus TaxID=1631 RepID=UPI002D98E1B5|nr:ECF-type thiazole transporter [Fructobacillus fructosus]
MKKRLSLKKMMATAILAALAYVLNTAVVFPAMAPFRHFVNVLAVYLLGPWYGMAAALICGSLRMLSGRTIMAITGGIIGPLLAGYLYRKTKNVYLLAIGEMVGSGILGALLSYPFMVTFYGMKAGNWAQLIPFFLPSAAVGSLLGLLTILLTKKNGLIDRMKAKINS